MIPKGFATQWEKLKKFYLLAIPTPTTTTTTNPGTISVANHPSGSYVTTVLHTTSSTPVKTIFNEMKIAWDKRGSNMKPATHLHHISHMRRLPKFALLPHTRVQPGSILGQRLTNGTVTGFKHPRLQNSTKSSRADSRTRMFKYTNVCENETVSILRVLMSETLVYLSHLTRSVSPIIFHRIMSVFLG